MSQGLIGLGKQGAARRALAGDRLSAIDNIAPGWRARTTYEILSDDEFRETFDLAGPGKEFGCYITNQFRRAKTSQAG
jgi:hypothetical protein